jgi:hypothetical protein
MAVSEQSLLSAAALPTAPHPPFRHTKYSFRARHQAATVDTCPHYGNDELAHPGRGDALVGDAASALDAVRGVLPGRKLRLDPREGLHLGGAPTLSTGREVFVKSSYLFRF